MWILLHIKRILLISFLLITQLCDAQYINERYLFTNSLSNVGWNAVENDNGYALVGSIRSNTTGKLGICFTQVDFFGNTLFEKRIEDTLYAYAPGYQNSLTKLTNGGFAVYGGRQDTPNESAVGILIRFDEFGDTLWTKTYGDTSYFQTGRHMRQTLDGGFILIGENATPTEYIWVIKTDSSGNVEWEQTYGGPNYEGPAHIAVCADGGYIFSGNTKSLGPNIPNEVNIRIMKIDSFGNEEFTKAFGNDNSEAPWCIEQTLDGGYFFGGSLRMGLFRFPYAIKMDNLGDTVWTKTYPESPILGAGGSTQFNMSVVLSDSNIVAAGAHWFSNGGSINRYDGLVIKMKPNGDTLWRKLYRVPGMDANGTDFHIKDIRPTSDGGFICAGTVYPAFPDTGTQDMWLLKIDSNGCADTACSLITSVPNTQNSQLNTNSLAVYPNPTNGIVTIELPKESTSGSFRLLNINGKEVFKQNLNSAANQIDISHLSKGIYFYRYRDNKQGYAGKLVIN
jgi:hypothetical protein